MSEYDSNMLKNDRLLTKPWRTRIVVLKKNEWVDIDLVGVLLFYKSKKDAKSEESQYLAIYRDIHYKSNIEKNPEINIIKPTLEEKVLKKLNQGFIMKEGECLLYSLIDKRNVYTLGSENFIEWKDKTIGEHIGLVFFNNMSCFETWYKYFINNFKLFTRKMISEIKKAKVLPIKKEKHLLNQIEMYFKQVTKQNLKMIKGIIEKNIKKMYDVCLSDEFLLQMREIFFIAEENLDRKTIEIQLQIIDIMTGMEQIFAILMDDNNYKWIYGIFEYAAENCGAYHKPHRKIIDDYTTYKNLNGILPLEISQKIRWCYRQMYLLDCILAADNEANFFFVLQRNIFILQQEILDEVMRNIDYILNEVFAKFHINWKDSIEFLIEMFTLIDSSIDINKKQIMVDKLKSLNFLDFSTNFITFLVSWNTAYIEKQIWILKYLKLLRNFIIYDTQFFLQFLQTEISRNLFLPIFSNLFIFYGIEIQYEIEEIWKLFLDDIDSNDIYNPFIDFLEKCQFFKEKPHIVELYFEEFLNLCLICFQKNPKIMILFYQKPQNSIENFFELALIKNKKNLIIVNLKIMKEFIMMDCLISCINEIVLKKYIYLMFIRYFSSKNNMIKSIFLDFFNVVIRKKRLHLLDLNIIMSKDFKKLNSQYSKKSPEKNIYLENTPSNPHLTLSIQKIDEFEAISKEFLPETLNELVIEEELHQKLNERTSIYHGRMSIEENMME